MTRIVVGLPFGVLVGGSPPESRIVAADEAGRWSQKPAKWDNPGQVQAATDAGFQAQPGPQ